MAVFFLFLFFISQFDLIKAYDFFARDDVPLITVFILLIIFGSVIKKVFHYLEPKISSKFLSFILPALFLCAVFVDITDEFRVVWWAFKVVAVPFLIFTIPVYYRLGFEYVKEHPEYRKMFIFGRGGAARWGGHSFLKYDFNAFMNHNEVKHAPIYCGGTLWYDDAHGGCYGWW